ncbi:hypothetical protein SAV14893_052590 [Streptomyces avermitilis]|uniref:Uncharacterized protein n=1 Tax=Streptomyces avermitilis TaxID=33903 RepID=A0A4D4M219_STRAX|nr:hypothetical protein SAVMC3_64960 [Streptomyces avermitilis]GDY65866.1 hypothetical protein SAV14893_052590 [Streptomyces avermitilis]
MHSLTALSEGGKRRVARFVLAAGAVGLVVVFVCGYGRGWVNNPHHASPPRTIEYPHWLSAESSPGSQWAVRMARGRHGGGRGGGRPKHLAGGQFAVSGAAGE